MKLEIVNKRIVLSLALMVLMALGGKAQSNLSFYSFDDQFNSSTFNPAFLTSQKKTTFSVFPLGGTEVGYNNQQVIRQMITKFLSGGINNDDYRDVLQSMVKHSSFNQDISTTLLTYTFRSKLGYFNFRVKEVETFAVDASGRVSNFIIQPDVQSVPLNIEQKLPAQAMHYREYSIGYALRNRRNNLSAGIRAKAYFGKASFFSEFAGSISSNYALTTGGKVYMSIPEGQTFSGDGTLTSQSFFNGSKTITYLLNIGNPGIGLDLGIRYRVNPYLTFSASIVDLGKISWKTNLNSKNFDGEYQLPASSFTQSTVDGIEVITKNPGTPSYAEDIDDMFELKPDSSAFARPLPVKVYAGLKYQLTPSLSISMTDRYIGIKDLSYNSFAITANFDVNKKLAISTGYSIIGNSFNNIPLCMLFRRDFGQIYMGTDNLMAFVLPSMSDFASLSFGTCFYLFRKRNLYKDTSDEYPFYRPKRIKRQHKNGLMLKSFPEF